jgi:formylmethanofuran dehydrogenase subunit A
VAIYNERPDDGFMFQYPRYVIKGGAVIVEEGELRNVLDGREFISRPSYEPGIEDFLRPLFQQYYTISFDNYPVEIGRIEHPEVRECR